MSNRFQLFTALKAGTISAVLLLAAVLGTSVQAQNVSTVITNGLFEPNSVATDPNGNVYITDSSDNRILKLVPPDGTLTSLAGLIGLTGTNNGTGTAARFSQPCGIVYARGGLVVADQANQTLRFVTLTGAVSNLAGHYSANGGFANGTGAAAQFSFPTGLAVDGASNIFVCDTGNNKIRKVDINNVVTTLALSFPPGLASFNQPGAVAVGDFGDLWVADKGHHIICNIDSSLVVKIVAGSPSFFSGNDDAVYGSPTTARFNLPNGLLWTGATGLLIADTGNHTIRRYYTNATVGDYSVVTVAGIPGQAGNADGDLLTAKFNGPIGLAFDILDSGFYVVDRANSLLRRLQTSAPLPAVPEPVIGYVTFVPNGSGTPVSEFHSVVQATFNTPVIIAIQAEGGTTTYVTDGPTPPNPLDDSIPPAPSVATGFTPAIYLGDGFDEATTLPSILPPSPDLTIKAIGEAQGRRASSIVRARFQFKVAGPNIGGNNSAALLLSDLTPGAVFFYTLDGSDPTNVITGTTSTGPIANNTTISFAITSNTTIRVRGYMPDGSFTPSDIVSKNLSPTDFSANKMTFGFDSGEGSSSFFGAAGQRFYAPITLSLLPGQKIYSMQFNVTVTNLPGAAAFSNGQASFSFQSLLQKPNPTLPSVIVIPPAMFDTTSLSFSNLVFTNAAENLLGVGWLERFTFSDLYDTIAQDLVTYSLAHDYLFFSKDGKVVVGAYSVVIPTNAANGSIYQIKIGRPSGTSDGIAQPVFMQLVTNGSFSSGAVNSIKNITVAPKPYIVGDVSPFRWYNAGDFGDTNLANNDVLQAFETAIYFLNSPTVGSDLFNAMDSSDGSLTNYTLDGNDTMINTITNGDGVIDVSDIYVTYRRSLDPALTWYARYWSNGVRQVMVVPNYTGNFAPSSPANSGNPAPKLASGPFSLSVAPDDVQGTAGQTLQIPVRAQVAGDRPIRTMMIGLTIQPLDGSPAITNGISFAPAAGLGSPTMAESKSPNNFAGAWLSSTVTGVSGNNIIGTLTVTLPPNADPNSAYLVHFDHFSASPNGLAVFPKTLRDSLITVGSRTNSSWHDGISDVWRLRNFGTISNLLSAANVDADGDGASNWAEFKAGTNPQDANSVLRLNGAHPTAPNFTLEWPTTLNTPYVVECSSTLFSTNWTVIASNLIGDGQLRQYVDPNHGDKARFYRVRVP